MHIPDGFLDAKTAVATGALAAAGLGLALRHARLTLLPRRVPLMGLTGAFLFAAQMLNFPVGLGTSGHLVGGTLAAVLLGPSAAVVVLSAVLVVQCFLFGDGGVTALGANLLNMALVGGLSGYAVYRVMAGVWVGRRGQIVGAAFGAWCGTVLSALCCAGQLASSGAAPARVLFASMGGLHLLIGLGEGAITALALATIVRSRPELLDPVVDDQPRRVRPFLAYGLIVSLGLALFLSPLVSVKPDGLDRTAEGLGFVERAAAVVPAPAGEYQVPGIPWWPLATALAGGGGTVVAFGLALGLARSLVPRARREAEAVTP